MSESAPIGHVDPGIVTRFEEFLSEDPDEAGEEVSPEPPPPPAPSPEPEPAPAPSGEEEEWVDPDGDEEDEAEAPVAAEPTEVIDTFSELAASFDVDENDLLEHLQVPGLDGDSVSLKQVIDSYRDGPALNEQFNVELEKSREQLREQSNHAVSELENATERLLQKIQTNSDPPGGWEALRQQDPAEYIRRREEQDADRRDAEAAISALEANTARQQAERDQRHKEYITEQAEKVYRMKPAWRDPEQGRVVFAEIQGYLQEMGFPAEQVEALEDALSIITVWKAAQYDKLDAQKPELRERLRRLPTKHVAVSARNEAAPQEARDKARKAVSDKFRQTGRIEDASALFGEHL